MTNLHNTADSTRVVVFGDIEQIAREERSARFGNEPEPPELLALRKRAREESEQIVKDALSQAEIIKEQAYRLSYKQGFEEGYAAGAQAARDELDSTLASWHEGIAGILDQIEQERSRIWSDAETQIVAFVLEVAQKVVKDEVAINKDVAMSVIHNAMRRVVDGNHLRVRVNPADLEHVRSNREELVALLDGIRNLEVDGDRRVGIGGCIVETNSGSIDARIETQFAEIRAILKREVEDGA